MHKIPGPGVVGLQPDRAVQYPPRDPRRLRGRGLLCAVLVIGVLLLCGTASAQEEEYGRLWTQNLTAPVSGMGISLDGSTIAVGAGTTLSLFDKNGHEIWSQPIGGTIQGVGLSPEGSYVGVAADKLYLFDREGNLLWIDKANNFPYHDVAISSNASHVAGACDDDTVYVFTREHEALWDASVGSDCYGIAISNDGRFIAIGCGDQGVYLLLNGEGELWRYGTGKKVGSIGMSPTGGYIAAGSHDRCVYLSTRGGDHLWKYPTASPIRGVAVASNQGGVVAGSGETLYLFSTEGNVTWQQRLGCVIEDVEISADGSVIVVGTGTGGYSLCLFTNDQKLLGRNAPDVPEDNETAEAANATPSPAAGVNASAGASGDGGMLAWLDSLFSILFNRPPGEFSG
ncbi:WD40 repeat domain-containing protein [Methanoculleus frigidifontis]|uniref:WD40 repeat domain-containing protein n=1 Tax=Methanoculleus frigidifontis TaxID=2584085 RepID=UPI0026593DF5|nr:WD40 repeat domain-containing protein [Methanoculleus sp. FWC-SCC1]